MRVVGGRVIAALLVALVALTGCQAKLDVVTHVERDGSGYVEIGIGVDDDASSRVGDLGQQLRVDDMRATGWQVGEPERASDGFTWIRARKAFTNPSEVGPITDQLTGPDGPFRDFALSRKSSWKGKDFVYKGIVDLSAGLKAFSDDELAQALGGDPFGGALEAVERETGRSAADMVDIRIAVELPAGEGSWERHDWNPGFADQAPTEISAKSSEQSTLGRLATYLFYAVVGFVILVVALVVARRRSRMRRY